jgi:fused signal recognition particle receptor
MFSFRRNKKEQKPADNNRPEEPVDQQPAAEASTETSEPEAPKSLRDRLLRSRSALGDQVADLFKMPRQIDDLLLEEIEELLLTADLGIDATKRIVDQLHERVKRREMNDGDAVLAALEKLLTELLSPVEAPLTIDDKHPFVILVVGVNGVGKTTTIGKLAKRFKDQGRSVMLAAGDTFRAAAVEQLITWGERNDVPVMAQKTGADSASVIFDALQSAKARNVDVLIADTAGRLHTQSNLMEELRKIERVMKKIDDSYPHEVLLVLDGGTGQNALSQAKLFGEAVGVSGLAVTKLDGTAKGGVIFALAENFGKPIRFIGVGESAEDLREFRAADYAKALMP